jgi:hypothetical protein
MKRILHGQCYLDGGNFWVFKCGIVKSDINHVVISREYTYNDQIKEDKPYGILIVGLRRHKLFFDNKGIHYTDTTIKLHYDTYSEADKVYSELLKDLEYLNKPLLERMLICVKQFYYKLFK